MTAAEPASPAPVIATYRVRAAVDPGALLRVLEPFAQRGLAPQRVSSRQAKGALLIGIRVKIDDPHGARIIAEKLAAMVSVFDADLALHAAEAAAAENWPVSRRRADPEYAVSG